jgi:two-component system phosphate regulon response regulator PhoB
MARVLLIERDSVEAAALARYLSAEGHLVHVASSGKIGVTQTLEQQPELVIVASALPDLAGTEVCRTLRGTREVRGVPVMILGARDDEIDRVVAFEVGADDFVPKPYSQRELSLRIRAILRRGNRVEPARPPTRVGLLSVDPDRHRALVKGSEVPLSALEFKLLSALYERQNRVQTRTALLGEVWCGVSGVSLRTVDACVKRLRHKLGDAGGYIQTVRGVGYRFIVQNDTV